MNRKAKIEGYAYDVAKRSNSTDSRSAAAEQAHRRRSVTASYRAEPRSAAWCGKRAPRPNQQRQQRQHVSSARQTAMRPSSPPRTPEAIAAPRASPPATISRGKKTTLFVVLGLIVIVYIVGIVAFSQLAYPNTTIAGVDVSFSNASSAATKVNSAWKHYKLTVTGDDFSWTYQPESDEPIVDGEAAAKEIISHNEAFVWPVRLVESLSGQGQKQPLPPTKSILIKTSTCPCSPIPLTKRSLRRIWAPPSTSLTRGVRARSRPIAPMTSRPASLPSRGALQRKTQPRACH